MNQAECAEALKLSEATISRYVSGDRVPSFNTMYRIRDVLLWSVEAQADAVRCGTYALEFVEKMERRQARRRDVDTPTVRGMSSASSSGDGVPPLEAGSEEREEGRLGEGTSQGGPPTVHLRDELERDQPCSGV